MLDEIRKAVLASCLLVAGSAGAETITAEVAALGFAGSPGLASPGSVDWNFTAPGGAATLAFQLAGYKSLDGDGNGWTDVFHLSVNSVEVLTGSWNLGGGGNHVIYYNPNGGTAIATAEPGTSWHGGIVDISVPITLQPSGSQTITFVYSSAIPQGTSDEGWGVNKASVTTVPLPAAIWLFGSACVGLGGLARRKMA